MLKFTMKRLVYLVLVLVGVSFLVFLLLYMTPGDPVRMMLGESATPEAQAELRLELGLDDPFLVQYGRYIKISWYIRIWERPTLPEDLSWMRL